LTIAIFAWIARAYPACGYRSRQHFLQNRVRCDA
jgi:hypothetical protein